MLLKKPGFTLIAVITLSLGIGAVAAIFSVVNAVLLRPLPYSEAERIVVIREQRGNSSPAQVTPANFLDWRAQQTSFELMAAYLTRNANLTDSNEPEEIGLVNASASFFDLLGVRPQIGRFFMSADEQAGHAPVAVISHSLWQRRFGGDRAVIGRNLTLDGQSYAVIGVTPPGFQFPKETDVWIPPLRLVPELNAQMDVTQVRGFGYLSAIARLKPGVKLEQAQVEMDVITARLRRQYPDTNGNRFNRVVSLREHLAGDVKLALYALLGGVGCVLLIACANVANLMLARAGARRREMAIRAALGAGRFTLIRQLLTESVMLASLGGLCGLLLALWSVDLLLALAPSSLPRVGEIGLDMRVLGFTLTLSLVTGLVFGLAPAWQISRPDLNSALRERARNNPVGGTRYRLRGLLVVAEVALSLLLLAGAGLLFRSFLHLRSVEPGFEPAQMLTMRVTPTGERYRDSAEQRVFYDQAIRRIAALPGVQRVGAINTLPLSKGPVAGFQIEGHPPLSPSQWPGANYRIVSPDYFHAMGIPIIQGRAFTERDTANATNVVIINQSLARRDFPVENPIGKRISFGRNERGEWLWFEIIGVAADVRSLELNTEPEPDFFATYQQVSFSGMAFVIRANVEPESLTAAARNAIRDVDPNLPVAEIRTMERIVYESIAQPRFNLTLLVVFACVALLLATAGIYGVMSFAVTQRTNEIGIRMALGACRGDVLRMVIGQGMRLALSGMTIGLVGSFVLTRLVKNLLFGVSATDPLTFIVITLLLIAVALLACYLPARRAMKVDPMIALRCE
jgi:putative ABC transport system permease protein